MYLQKRLRIIIVLYLLLGTFVMAGAQEEPVQGGEFIFAHGQDVDTLDPHQSSVSTTGMIARNLFDTLIMYDQEGNLHPALAVSWDISNDATTYTFHLRDDVIFHDGTTFDAEAAKFNFERITAEDFPAGIAGATLGNLDSVTVLDTYTIQLNFSEPNIVFLDAVAFPWLSMISPAAVEELGDDFGRNPVGSGPFKFVEWVEKDHATMERNPDYNWASSAYGHNGPAYLDRVTIKFAPETGTRVAAFFSGEVDGMYNVPPLELTVLEEDPEFQALLLQAPGVPVGLPINTENPPTNDILVRQAIITAVDRQTLSETLRQGVDPPASGPLSPATDGYASLVEEYYSYDPGKAAELLEEAGWIDSNGDGIREKDGEELNITLLQPQGLMDWMEFVQANLREVGINVEIRTMPISAWLDAAGAGEGHLSGIALEGHDPNVLRSQYHSENIDSGFNWSRHKSEELDRFLETGAATADPEERDRIYAEVQKIIMDQALWAPIYNIASLTGLHSYVNGYVVDVTREFHQFYDVSITSES